MADASASFFASFFQNSKLKFYDDLFNYVLKETEGIESTPRFNDLPLVFPLFQVNVGKSAVEILEISGPHINEFYERIKDKLQVRKNLRTRLGLKFLLDGKALDTLYFLSVTSRIFALFVKIDEQSTNVYIRECVKGLEGTASGANALSGFMDIVPLVKSIVENGNWQDGSWQDAFRSLNIGEVDFYFPAEAGAESGAGNM